jgi:arylsulfatase A
MLEGGANVPLIVNWPGKTPAGKVTADLIDSTDFLPTFAELAGAPLPAKTVIDGRTFAPQLQGKKGQPREWIFIQLARMWYVRDAKYKLDQTGQLFDMSKAPFEEIPLPATAAAPARARLQAALAKLNPAGGILDTGDGTGRHAGRDANKKKKKER